MEKTISIYLGGGIGNIISATPMIKAIRSLGYKVNLNIFPTSRAAYEILEGWEIVNNMRLLDGFVYIGKNFHYTNIVYTYCYQSILKVNCEDDTILFPKEPNWDRISEIEHNMELAYRLGYKGEIPVVYAGYEECSIPSFKNIRPVVAVAPGCFPNKESLFKHYPHFNALIGELLWSSFNVVLLGAKSDWGLEDMNWKGPSMRNLIGEFSIRITGGVIKRCSCLISSDTGLVHYATALGVPAIAIYGPTSVKKNAMPGEIVVKKELECQPCMHKKNFLNCESRECLNIDPEVVVNRVRELLG